MLILAPPSLPGSLLLFLLPLVLSASPSRLLLVFLFDHRRNAQRPLAASFIIADQHGVWVLQELLSLCCGTALKMTVSDLQIPSELWRATRT